MLHFLFTIAIIIMIITLFYVFDYYCNFLVIFLSYKKSIKKFHAQQKIKNYFESELSKNYIQIFIYTCFFLIVLFSEFLILRWLYFKF